MKKLLITGFMPFGGEEINPSWQAVSILPDTINGYSLTKLLLPVVFGRAAEAVIEKANEINPDYILCIGQAGGRDSVTPELVGINLANAEIPDNLGNMPKDEEIIADGNAAYFSTLPVRKITAAINAAGVPCRLSYSAGAYVCNSVLYSLLAYFEGTQTRVGFIHVPYVTEQGKKPSLPLDQIVKALRVAIVNIEP